MNNKIALESLAMDLKRVAIGYQRGSVAMADRFYQEALQRMKEIDPTIIKPYMRNLLHQVKEIDKNNCEHVLTLSTLIQNYTQIFA